MAKKFLGTVLIASLVVGSIAVISDTPATAATEPSSEPQMANGLIVEYADKSLRKVDPIGFGLNVVEFSEPKPIAEAAELANQLEDFSTVKSAAPNRMVKIATDSKTITSSSAISWGIDRIDQASLPLNDTYSYGPAGSGVKAYVVDSGIRTTHNEFIGRVATGFNSADDTTNVADCLGHGTHVSGTIGGTIAGVAKKVTLVPVKVFPGCSEYTDDATIIHGLDWIKADHSTGPAVVNMSLGGPADDSSVYLTNAVNSVIADGVTVVVASGNDFMNACDFSPANITNAITVNASTEFDRPASFTNYGSCTDIYAPGEDIFAASNYADEWGESMSGTSMASPHVAGAAAQILSAFPTLTPADVWTKIKSLAVTFKNPVSRSDARIFLNIFKGTLPVAPTSPTATVAFAGSSANATVSWSVSDQSAAWLDLTAVRVTAYDKSSRGTVKGSCSPATMSDTSCVISSLAKGKTFYLDIVFTNPLGSTAIAGSRAAFETTAPFTSTTIPTISYSSLVNKSRLTAVVADWGPKAKFKYQWLRDGLAISRATSSTYKLNTSDLGHAISVAVTGSATGVASATTISAAVNIPG